jgi:hypothetical protein
VVKKLGFSFWRPNKEIDGMKRRIFPMAITDDAQATRRLGLVESLHLSA